jgi:hypothetical protein
MLFRCRLAEIQDLPDPPTEPESEVLIGEMAPPLHYRIGTERVFEGEPEQALCAVSVHVPGVSAPPSVALIWPAE